MCKAMPQAQNPDLHESESVWLTSRTDMMASVARANEVEASPVNKERGEGRSDFCFSLVAEWLAWENKLTGIGMTFKFNFLPIHRSRVLNSAREISSVFWSGSVTAEELSASRGCLRRFILLKLVTELLLPRGAAIPMLLGCIFSLQALLLLRSAHISTKPSTVFLAQLALSDTLVLLHWALPPGAALAWRVREMSWNAENGFAEEGHWLWWREAVSALCQQLLDAHHLASLLLLGLLGLEATLVLRWPQQTRRFRTSQQAQLCCSLVWILALTELGLSNCLQQPGLLTYSSTLQHWFPLPVPAFSPGLRQILWLGNVWMHYFVFYSKPQKRKSSFH